MEKEDLKIHLQGHFGLTLENLEVDFSEGEQELRIKYDLRGYDQLRPPNLDDFWEQLQVLPSAETTQEENETRELRVNRKEVEELLSRLDPPIQA